MTEANPNNSMGGQTTELSKTYRPSEHETRVWQKWEEAKAFHADPGRVLRGEAKAYSMVIPPPNVTAALHLGHALNNSIQDILVRAHRMMGFETLWMPGTDHAGIATQAVVEKRVQKEEKKRRTDFSREEFVAKIQAFKDEYEAIITGQLKAMGCSCDWDRQRFTMDEVCARAVREAFFRLFKDGLIYRGKRLVNWDPVLQTAVADDECYDEDIYAAFYYLRYPLVHPHGATTARERHRGVLPPGDPVPVTWSELEARGYPGAELHPGEEQAYVTVATTRPETYLGDTAVAVNPHDPRAKALRGLCAELPLVGRVIPIVEDDYVVLPAAESKWASGLNLPSLKDGEAEDPKAAFATGFLKVTPAHDQNDNELYSRHKEKMDTFAGGAGKALVNMMSPDGRVSDKHGWTDIGDAHIFVGKKMAEARKLVIEEFKVRTPTDSSATLLAETRPYRHSIKHSDRSKAVIEPWLSDQWYVRVTDPKMASAANAALVAEQISKQQSSKAANRTGIEASRHQGIKGEDGDGSMRFYPGRYAKTYELWHDNIRDWCISRQLWWGHRIPVWSRQYDLGAKDSGEIFSNEIDEALEGNHEGCFGIAVDASSRQVIPPDALYPFDTKSNSHRLRPHGVVDIYICDIRGTDWASSGFVQDADVLDTWFSSALWPMSTMGWPDPAKAGADFTGMLEAFNPTSTLCTAREIITLWVSRMVMFNRYFLGTGTEPRSHEGTRGSGFEPGPVPFHDVFIPAMIQDGEGRKMSKSLGNGVDPLDIIATHGADAMRFTLCEMTTQTQDVRMPVEKDSATGKNTSRKFDLGRNFCNKLWNSARFVMEKLGEGAKAPTPPLLSLAGLSLPDRWMLSRLALGVNEATKALKEYQFSDYAKTCYDLLWRDFCDWYLEAIKPTVASDASQRAVLRAAMETILRLLHPVMPFVTEAINEQLSMLPLTPVKGLELAAARKGGLLCTAGWPVADLALLRDEKAEAEFERLRAFITAIRDVRAQHKVLPRRQITLHAPAGLHGFVKSAEAMIFTLAGLEKVTADKPSGPAVALRFESFELSLSNMADAADAGAAAEAEKAMAAKKLAELEKAIATLEARLANPGYAERAPAAMVQQTKDQLAKAKAERSALVG